MAFTKASKKQAKLRLALQGPAGSGKTYSALAIAEHLTNEGEAIAVVDTEHRSADKYAHRFSFLVDQITENYHPDRIAVAIADAVAAGAGVIIIDSMTAFWNGPGGILELVDNVCARQKARGGRADSFAAWKEVDPLYKRMVHALLTAPIHVICTLRAKTEYQRTEDANGKARIQKMGLAPEIRDSFQYEMDVEGMLDMEHNLVIGKTRCDTVDGRVFHKPGKDMADMLRAWLEQGEAPAVQPPSPQAPPANGAAGAVETPGKKLARLSKELQARGGNPQQFAKAVTGKEHSKDMTAEDVATLVRALDIELHGDGEPESTQASLL